MPPNKAPTEISAKTPVSRLRKVVALGDFNPARKRDPRFDDLSGQFNQGLFEKAYSFLPKLEESELGMIEAELKKIKGKPGLEDRTEELSQLRQRKLQQRQARKAEQQERQVKRQAKKEELSLIQQQGKRPFYLKKGQQRELLLKEKFKQLSGEGELEKILEKRRKRTANRQHKRLPYKIRPLPSSSSP